jgi:GDP-4-dehydro-6-deoxy-D-mannose reductase
VRVLITGAGGFAGGHLIAGLLADGAQVWGGTLEGEPPSRTTLSAAEARKVGWTRMDVTDSDCVADVMSATAPDQIFHLAGQSSVADSYDDVPATWEVNALGTVRLLESVRQRAPRARVLVVSTAEVHGRVSNEDLPVQESLPLRPLSPYGASKAAAEIAALQAAAQGLEVVVARSFNHIGPGQDSRFAIASFAEQLIQLRAAQPGDRVLQVGNLEVFRDFLDVRDAVRAYRLLLMKGSPGEVYNVCSGTAHRLGDLVQQLVEIAVGQARIEVDQERVRPVDVPVLRGDPGRLRALGWAPSISLAQTLRDLLDHSAAAASI